jgi:hypothetical protein
MNKPNRNSNLELEQIENEEYLETLSNDNVQEFIII